MATVLGFLATCAVGTRLSPASVHQTMATISDWRVELDLKRQHKDESLQKPFAIPLVIHSHHKLLFWSFRRLGATFARPFGQSSYLPSADPASFLLVLLKPSYYGINKLYLLMHVLSFLISPTTRSSCMLGQTRCWSSSKNSRVTAPQLIWHLLLLTNCKT